MYYFIERIKQSKLIGKKAKVKITDFIVFVYKIFKENPGKYIFILYRELDLRTIETRLCNSLNPIARVFR